MKVYIAGPYTKGDVAINVHEAIKVADKLLGLGYIPFVPHLTHFWHLLYPQEYIKWLEYDQQWLEDCEAVLRLPGESEGADREVNVAKSIHIPVYYSLLELIENEPI